MLKNLTQYIKDVRYGDAARKKRVMIVATIAIFLIILVLWLVVFGVQSAATGEPRSASDDSGNVWREMKSTFAKAQEAMSASMRLLSSIPTEELATSTASSTPVASASQAPLPSVTSQPSPTPSFQSSPQPSVVQLH